MREGSRHFNELEKSADEEYLYNLLECFYVGVYIHIYVFISVIKVTLTVEAQNTQLQ